jgi:hypothetical protein
MGKSRFVNDNDLLQIDLGDGDWVRIPKQISWQMLAGSAKDKSEELEQVSTRLLARIIKAWNLKDRDWETNRDFPIVFLY